MKARGLPGLLNYRGVRPRQLGSRYRRQREMAKHIARDEHHSAMRLSSMSADDMVAAMTEHDAKSAGAVDA